MPNRNVEGNYRYAYQGQEKDPETGKEAFELRLWDSRIGRWLSIDPYGFGYIGMGNNPISNVDPTGGCTCEECPQTCADNVHQLDTVIIGDVSESIPSGSWGADAVFTLGDFNSTYAGSTQQYQTTYPEFAGMNYQQMVSHFETNQGARFEAEYKWNEAYAEILRKEEVALHMMGAMRYYIMMNEVVAPGQFKSPRFKLRRNGPLTGIPVTKVDIKKILIKANLKTVQGKVSLPVIRRYVRMLEQGLEAPPIKVDAGVVVEGNHRYIAGLLYGKLPKTVPGRLPPSQRSRVMSMKDTEVDYFDWGNR